MPGKLYDDPSEKAKFLASCAQTANITGEYKTAIEFYRAIEPGRTTQNFDMLNGLLEQLDGSEKKSFQKNDPRYPVNELLFWALTDGRRLDRLKKFVELPETEKLTDKFFETEIQLAAVDCEV